VRHTCNSLSPWPIKGRRTPPPQRDKTEETRQNNNTRHTTHLLSNSPATSSVTSPGTWKPCFLSRLACSSPTTGTHGAEQYSASSTPLLDVRPSAGTRINLVFLIAWHRPLRDRPWHLLLVSVGTTFRTDSSSGCGLRSTKGLPTRRHSYDQRCSSRGHQRKIPLLDLPLATLAHRPLYVTAKTAPP
jgi:hypothetical protein